MSSKIKAEDFSVAKKSKDVMKTVIRRSNMENEFTIEDIVEHNKKILENEKTLNAQVKLTEAVIGNITRNHPLVAKLTDDQIKTVAYLQENLEVLQQTKAKLKEFEATKKKYKEIFAILKDNLEIDVEA